MPIIVQNHVFAAAEAADPFIGCSCYSHQTPSDADQSLDTEHDGRVLHTGVLHASHFLSVMSWASSGMSMHGGSRRDSWNQEANEPLLSLHAQPITRGSGMYYLNYHPPV